MFRCVLHEPRANRTSWPPSWGARMALGGLALAPSRRTDPLGRADEHREAIAVGDALEHGNACMRVFVGGTPVMFDHGRVPAPADVAVRTA